MPKPYSQEVRDRVIDAVETGKMSRHAAGRSEITPVLRHLTRIIK
jgi:hypothetical protein